MSNKPTFVFEGKKYQVNDPKLDIPGIGIRTAAEIAVDKKSQKALILAGLAGDSITCLDEDDEQEEIAALAMKNPALRGILAGGDEEEDEDEILESLLKAQAAAVEKLTKQEAAKAEPQKASTSKKLKVKQPEAEQTEVEQPKAEQPEAEKPAE